MLRRFTEQLAQTSAEQDPRPLLRTRADLMRALPWVCAASPFVARSCIQDPTLIARLARLGLLGPAGFSPLLEYLAAAERDMADPNPDDLARRLRVLRREGMVALAWRDICGEATVGETLEGLTRLADTCVRAALSGAHKTLRDIHGTPRDRQGREQALIVLGLGKLGGGELNYSSDIDLILLYPDQGVTDGPKQLENQAFFIRLGQRLARTLSEMTQDGFVFRVDLRLRPWGDAGPVAISLDAFDGYLRRHGREWERYALVKARAITGTAEDIDRLDAHLQAFVYRAYPDFSAFASLREMKAMIAADMARRGRQDNIKLGRGGIREIEFIAQAFQLLRGGRNPALRSRSLIGVLQQLGVEGELSPDTVQTLTTAYWFLRWFENRMQMVGDAQTHSLPSDEFERVRLAVTMGYPDWPTLMATLDAHRQAVDGHFRRIFQADDEAQGEGDRGDDPAVAAWRNAETADASALHGLGFDDPAAALEGLRRLRGISAYRQMHAEGRALADALVPRLVAEVAGTPDASEALARVLQVIASVLRRTTYLHLLLEQPAARAQLIRLCAASPWITRLIASQPILLDRLLDPEDLHHPLTRAQIEAEISVRFAQLPAEDFEQQMEALRQIKQQNVLRVAAADLSGFAPLMRVSDRLTWIAEAVLTHVLRLAWAQLSARHGIPRVARDGAEYRPGIGIVGYGKLGGFELGYGSDLDLVFLHDAEGKDLGTDGPRPIETPVFLSRLVQRMLHILGATTPSGVLYEIDVRLRPNGASGLLVSSLEAFARYQREQAWTWEHQALVRARMVTGSQRLRERFDGIRDGILALRRDREALRRAVADMRARQVTELGNGDPTRFDLKHDRGGIGDIEFIVQYLTLAYGARHPALRGVTDNIRLLEALARERVLTIPAHDLLMDAYRHYRALIHRRALQGERPIVQPDGRVRRLRIGVARLWQVLMVDHGAGRPWRADVE